MIQVRDVCYWMNVTLMEKERERESEMEGELREREREGERERESSHFCLNTAVEATTLTARVGGWEVRCVGGCMMKVCCLCQHFLDEFLKACDLKVFIVIATKKTIRRS